MAEDLRSVIAPVLASPGAGICVALSGGLDSTVLLHLLARGGVHPLRAVYVDHQLHPDAVAWGERCRLLCAALGVPFATERVTVESRSGEGLEAAARRARYGALSAVLAPGELLVTAHHRDDQVETVIMNLMRGSGVAGIAGIPRRAPLGGGFVLRPLLDVPRAVLFDYAAREGLTWIEDPANADEHMDRNYLRHQVLPALARRWPGMRGTVARSARLCAEAAGVLDELAAQDARRVQRAGRVSIPALRALSEPRRRNLLRHLCRNRLGSVPSESHLGEGLTQLLAAGGDRNPALSWAGGEIRRYRDALYLLPPLTPAPAHAPLTLRANAGGAVDLGYGCGRLRLVRSRGSGLSASKVGGELAVRYRVGGERIQPLGSGHARELKKLLQERGVVPWMRERIPLLWSGDALAAVADLWVAAEFAAGAAEQGLRVHWQDHPPIE